MTTWEQVRQESIDSGHLDLQRLEALGRWQLDRVRAHRLAEVRTSLGKSQIDVAKTMQVSQARVSKIERGELTTAQVGTLQAYVRALGGELDIVARFGDERIVVADERLADNLWRDDATAGVGDNAAIADIQP